MGEPKIGEVEEKLESARGRTMRFIDPYKMAMWPIDLAIEMVGGAVSRRTIDRAIETRELNGYKPGKEICVVPAEFVTWLKRFRK